MKKLISIIIATATIIGMSLPTYAYNYTIKFGNTVIAQGSDVVNRNGRLLINYSALGKIPGGEVTYNAISHEVIYKNGYHVYSNKIKEVPVYEDGLLCYASDARSDYINNTVPYIPLRAFVESMRDEENKLYSLSYDNSTQTVNISYSKGGK
jgi:hypothetical protein